MSDTDSVAALVQSKDLVTDFKALSHKMDFSNYPPNHPLFDDSKKRALYHWKDETGGSHDIVEHVTLRAKCYSYKSKPNLFAPPRRVLRSALAKAKCKETKLCKGILRSCVKNDLTFDMYKEALFESRTFKSRFYNIGMRNNELFTRQIVKSSLSALCTKRYWLECGYHSVPFNSAEINKYGDKCWRCRSFEAPDELTEYISRAE